MAIDSKYGRVQIERGSIGEDEPVVVFRAQDKLLPAVLEHYRMLCDLNGSPARHLDGINEAPDAVVEWQAGHHTQVPRSDPPEATDG